MVPLRVSREKLNSVTLYNPFKGTPLRSGRVTHLKRTFSKTYTFLLPTYLVYCQPITDILRIKVPQDRLQYPTHVDNKKKQGFFFKCVTQPHPSRVPLKKHTQKM